jgi:hypothetical protein
MEILQVAHLHHLTGIQRSNDGRDIFISQLSRRLESSLTRDQRKSPSLSIHDNRDDHPILLDGRLEIGMRFLEKIFPRLIGILIDLRDWNIHEPVALPFEGEYASQGAGKCLPKSAATAADGANG